MTREEAIDIIRKNIPHLGIGTTEMTEALKELIPELRENESEDERIRKWLVQYIKDTHPIANYWNGAPKIPDVLAWLEKQKEQKLVMGNGISEQTKINETVYKFTPEEWKKALDEQLPKEQKPVEWSERQIADVFEKVGLAKIVRELANDNLTNALQSAMIELASPVEWSEEDELMRKRCIADLGYLIAYEPQYKERYDEQIVWLKSLPMKCPNSSDIWKPSEGQLTKLYCIAEGIPDDDDAKVLKELYEQLKKL